MDGRDECKKHCCFRKFGYWIKKRENPAKLPFSVVSQRIHEAQERVRCGIQRKFLCLKRVILLKIVGHRGPFLQLFKFFHFFLVTTTCVEALQTLYYDLKFYPGEILSRILHATILGQTEFRFDVYCNRVKGACNTHRTFSRLIIFRPSVVYEATDYIRAAISRKISNSNKHITAIHYDISAYHIFVVLWSIKRSRIFLPRLARRPKIGFYYPAVIIIWSKVLLLSLLSLLLLLDEH